MELKEILKKELNLLKEKNEYITFKNMIMFAIGYKKQLNEKDIKIINKLSKEI